MQGQYTFLSAFSGAGGLDLGLEAAGLTSLGHIEVDESARQTLQRNRPDWEILDPGDIRQLATDIRPSDLGLRPGQLTILAGGPPCQPFSKAAQWAANGVRGMQDERAEPITSFFELTASFLPQWLLIENVPGFVRGRTSALAALQHHLQQLNNAAGTRYRLCWRVVDAHDFGVPQKRRRAILMANVDGERPAWPEAPKERRSAVAWDALADADASDAREASGRWADLLPSIPEGENYQWHTDRGGGDPLFGYRTRYWSFLLKLAKSQPAWTLPAQPGPSTGPFHWDNRPLTVAEMTRLQTFPRHWRLAGPLREQIRQAGNATPPLLGEILGRSIIHKIMPLDDRLDRTLTLRLPRKRQIPGPEPVASTPAPFKELVGEHEPHPGPGLGPGAESRTQELGDELHPRVA